MAMLHPGCHLDLSFGLCASTISAWWAHLAAMEAEWLLDKHVEATSINHEGAIGNEETANS